MLFLSSVPQEWYFTPAAAVRSGVHLLAALLAGLRPTSRNQAEHPLLRGLSLDLQALPLSSEDTSSSWTLLSFLAVGLQQCRVSPSFWILITQPLPFALATLGW